MPTEEQSTTRDYANGGAVNDRLESMLMEELLTDRADTELSSMPTEEAASYSMDYTEDTATCNTN